MAPPSMRVRGTHARTHAHPESSLGKKLSCIPSPFLCDLFLSKFLYRLV